MHRREFIQGATVAGLAGLAPSPASASSAPSSARDHANDRAVLVDISQCIGCRKCEWACHEVNGLPPCDDREFEDVTVFDTPRRPDDDCLTVVNRLPSAGPNAPDRFGKVQCMHCADPACASACIVSALEKRPEGPVVYDESRCIGCRYCMVACPFQIPAYEYDDPFTPRVRKCSFCAERIEAGEADVPGCISICPPQCLTYGPREDILRLAHRKIDQNGVKYLDHVYGEHEVGGTSWVYISDRPFEQAGLPALPEAAPPRLTESIQHGIFQGFIPPLGLYAVLGSMMWLSRPSHEPALATAGAGAKAVRPEDVAPAPKPEPHPEGLPAGARPMGPISWGLGVVAAIGLVFAILRIVLGLESTTNLSDRFPWGLWIGIDVATGVALAAGGFTTAALAHVFHREEYRAIVRPGLLSALLGYTFVVIGLLFDLGRYYAVWHPMLPSMWSGNSVLFEVGMCVMVYLTVLYFEFVPIVVERFLGKVHLPGGLAKFDGAVERLLRVLDGTFARIMPLLVIAGVVLSCLHQSSLGSLLLIAPSKMHPLWYTPIMPFLFLVSAISVGFPVVVLESFASASAFGRKPEVALVGKLARFVPPLLGILLVARFGDLAIRGQLGLLLVPGVPALMYWIETALVAVPMLILLSDRARASSRLLLTAALMVIASVVVNRVDVFLVAYTPPIPGDRYVPSLPEIAVTLGLFSALALAYRWIAARFPVLPPEEAEENVGAGGAS